eukprot:3917572-Pleurochrysis_carterae.AAC.1
MEDDETTAAASKRGRDASVDDAQQTLMAQRPKRARAAVTRFVKVRQVAGRATLHFDRLQHTQAPVAATDLQSAK